MNQKSRYYFVPGGSYPEIAEEAEAWKEDMPYVLPSGSIASF